MICGIEGLIEQVDKAELQPAIYRTARRLIDRMGEGGSTDLTWEEYLLLSGCPSQLAARRHLTELVLANLCKFRAGDRVIVYWAHVASARKVDIINEQNARKVDITDSESARKVDITDDESARKDYIRNGAHVASARKVDIINEQNARKVDNNNDSYVDLARGRYRNGASLPLATSHAGARFGWLVDPIQINGSNGSNQPTNQPEPDRAVAHGLTMAILLHCRVAYAKAKVIADNTPFLEVRRQVAAWLPEREAARNPAGLLIHRIESHYPAPEIDSDFKRTPFYRDYMTPQEKAAEAAIEAQAEALAARIEQEAEEEAPEPTSAPIAPPSEAPESIDALWQRAKTEFLHNQPLNSPMREWLEGSALLRWGRMDDDGGIERDLYRIVLARPQGLDWIRNRAISLIGRTVGSMLGRRIIVEIVCEAEG